MPLSRVNQLLHQIKYSSGDQREVIQHLTDALSALAKVVEEHENTIRRLTNSGRYLS